MNNTPITPTETPEQAAARFSTGLIAKGYQLDGFYAYHDSLGNFLILANKAQKLSIRQKTDMAYACKSKWGVCLKGAAVFGVKTSL